MDTRTYSKLCPRADARTMQITTGCMPAWIHRTRTRHASSTPHTRGARNNVDVLHARQQIESEVLTAGRSYPDHKAPLLRSSDFWSSAPLLHVGRRISLFLQHRNRRAGDVYRRPWQPRRVMVSDRVAVTNAATRPRCYGTAASDRVAAGEGVTSRVLAYGLSRRGPGYARRRVRCRRPSRDLSIARHD